MDEVILHADDDLVEQLARFEAMGVRLQEMQSHRPQPGARTLVLVDKEDRMLMTCLVRMELLEQIKEMLDTYEHLVLDPKATRH